MTRFQVTIARITDQKMFRREFLAQDETAALRQATALLSTEKDDYYVVDIVAA